MYTENCCYILIFMFEFQLHIIFIKYDLKLMSYMIFIVLLLKCRLNAYMCSQYTQFSMNTREIKVKFESFLLRNPLDYYYTMLLENFIYCSPGRFGSLIVRCMSNISYKCNTIEFITKNHEQINGYLDQLTNQLLTSHEQKNRPEYALKQMSVISYKRCKFSFFPIHSQFLPWIMKISHPLLYHR